MKPPIPRTSRYGKASWTTGQVARLLDVTPQTVINWIKARKLIAERIEMGPRKIKLLDLIEFMLKNKIHIPEEMLYAGALSQNGAMGRYRLERQNPVDLR